MHGGTLRRQRRIKTEYQECGGVAEIALVELDAGQRFKIAAQQDGEDTGH